MKYPNGKLYETLYAKYINEKNLFEMMDLAGDYKGKKFLDICSGTCRATKEAITRGTSKCAVIDKSEDMLPNGYLTYKKVYIYCGDIRDTLGRIERSKLSE